MTKGNSTAFQIGTSSDSKILYLNKTVIPNLTNMVTESDHRSQVAIAKLIKIQNIFLNHITTQNDITGKYLTKLLEDPQLSTSHKDIITETITNSNNQTNVTKEQIQKIT